MSSLTRLRSIALFLIFSAVAAACSFDSGGATGGLTDDGVDDAVDDGDDGDGTDDGADDGVDDAGDDGDGADAADGDGDGADAADGDGEPDGAVGVPDSAPPDAEPPPVVEEGPYEFLSESGLYSDIETHTIASNVMAFEPEFELWSDGAEKARYIRLPPGGQINSNNMARWNIPNGTTVWKEFADPDTGKRLETRIIQRLSNGTFYFASFIWNGDDSEAVFDDTPGTSPPRDIPAGCSSCTTPPCNNYPDACHVVPQASKCIECHAGEPGRLLGFSAVQLSHDGPGITLSDLASLGLMTSPPPTGTTFPVPGTAVERNAIGTLHANCGHCHSSFYGQTACFSATQFQARVLPDDATVEDTAIFQSVDAPLQFWVGPMQGNHTEEQLGELITDRIVSGDASRSAIWYRMSVREFGQLPPNNDHQQMPYFATNQVDEAGLAAVELWINSLP